MKPSISIIMILLFSFTSYSQNSDLEQLRHIKEVLWPKAYYEQDTLLLDQLLADEFQMIDDQGISYTKTEELEYIKNNKPSYSSFNYEITRLEVFENNTAIISGSGFIENQDNKGEFLLEYKSSNVLIKRNQTWVAISSHVSGIKKDYKH